VTINPSARVSFVSLIVSTRGKVMRYKMELAENNANIYLAGGSMYQRIVFVICLFAGSVAHAAQDNPNNIWLSYSQDANDTTSTAALLSLGLGPDDQLVFGAAQNTAQYNTQTLETNDYSLIYSTLRLSPWSIDVGYDYRGKEQELVVQTVNLSPVWHGEIWTLGINLETRSLAFYTRYLAIISGQREVDADSSGIGPVLGLDEGNWSWSLSGMSYTYSKDLSKLNLRFLKLIFGIPTISQATTLSDWFVTTQLKYNFTSFGIGAKFLHSISALDNLATDSISALLDIKFSKAVSLNLEAGRAYAPNDVTTDFGSVGLSIDF
jgi:hypothetical protein